MIRALPALLVGLTVAVAAPAGAGMVTVGPGTYRPLYPPSEAERAIEVPAFSLDVHPVTNADFLAFVQAHPAWARDKARRLYVDDRYLAHWASPTQLGEETQALQPVTHVSWFAARAYCAAQDARLPTEREWELAAAASPDKADATGDAAWRSQILNWYAKPSTAPLPPVGSTPANVWGVRDLHGVVWEWVEDFGNSLVTSDSREGGDEEGLRFCGAGAVSAQEVEDYAAFMRIAFRSSLNARYTTKNLGFRCARGGTP